MVHSECYISFSYFINCAFSLGSPRISVEMNNIIIITVVHLKFNKTNDNNLVKNLKLKTYSCFDYNYRIYVFSLFVIFCQGPGVLGSILIFSISL